MSNEENISGERLSHSRVIWLLNKFFSRGRKKLTYVYNKMLDYSPNFKVKLIWLVILF